MCFRMIAVALRRKLLPVLLCFFSFIFFYALLCLCVAGKMFPTIGDVHLAPFTDEQLYMEQFTKANFW